MPKGGRGKKRRQNSKRLINIIGSETFPFPPRTSDSPPVFIAHGSRGNPSKILGAKRAAFTPRQIEEDKVILLVLCFSLPSAGGASHNKRFYT